MMIAMMMTTSIMSISMMMMMMMRTMMITNYKDPLIQLVEGKCPLQNSCKVVGCLIHHHNVDDMNDYHDDI